MWPVCYPGGGGPQGPAGRLQEGWVQDLSPRPHELLLLPYLHFPRLKSLLSMGTGHFIWNNGLLMWNWGFLPQKLTFLNASKTALSLPIRRLGTNTLCNTFWTWVCRESWPLEAGTDVQRSRRFQWLPSVLWICELHKIKCEWWLYQVEHVDRREEYSRDLFRCFQFA